MIIIVQSGKKFWYGKLKKTTFNLCIYFLAGKYSRLSNKTSCIKIYCLRIKICGETEREIGVHREKGKI